MNRLILTAALTICLVGVARADLFNFNSLSDEGNSTTISTYMTGVYGSTVTVSDATADNDNWNGNTTIAIRTASSVGGDFEILFVNTPIISLLGIGGTGSTVGYVYDATSGDDFSLKAYDSTYGDVENPNPSAQVDIGYAVDYGTAWFLWWQYDVGDDSVVNIPDLMFSRPVSLLVISDEGTKDVGIDNLQVTPVPVPAAVLLGMLGLSVAGLKLRKFA